MPPSNLVSKLWLSRLDITRRTTSITTTETAATSAPPSQYKQKGLNSAGKIAVICTIVILAFLLVALGTYYFRPRLTVLPFGFGKSPEDKERDIEKQKDEASEAARQTEVKRLVEEEKMMAEKLKEKERMEALKDLKTFSSLEVERVMDRFQYMLRE